jgi:hypothetical protein
MGLFTKRRWVVTGKKYYPPQYDLTKGGKLTKDQKCLLFGYTVVSYRDELSGRLSTERIVGEHIG